jgi:hypothetical protein
MFVQCVIFINDLNSCCARLYARHAFELNIYVKFHIHTTAMKTGKLNIVIVLHQMTTILKRKAQIKKIFINSVPIVQKTKAGIV